VNLRDADPDAGLRRHGISQRSERPDLAEPPNTLALRRNVAAEPHHGEPHRDGDRRGPPTPRGVLHGGRTWRRRHPRPPLPHRRLAAAEPPRDRVGADAVGGQVDDLGALHQPVGRPLPACEMRDKPTHVVGEHECRRRRGSHARPSRPGDRAFPGGLISIPPGAIDPEQTYIDGATNFADAVLAQRRRSA
jgi:hypothetical protein